MIGICENNNLHKTSSILQKHIDQFWKWELFNGEFMDTVHIKGYNQQENSSPKH
jgi:hypothetical protein